MELSHQQMMARRKDEKKGNQTKKVNNQKKKAVKRQKQIKVLETILEMKKGGEANVDNDANNTIVKKILSYHKRQ
eukprot:7241715-Ditylum_brightwellii.AAC.1